MIMGEMGRVIEFPRHRREPEPLLTMRDLVERYQMSERWFRYRLAEGMPAHRWGGRWRFRASEVEAWMEARGAS
jgi:predicted DNA-binding transcriptional regulator AlpA